MASDSKGFYVIVSQVLNKEYQQTEKYMEISVSLWIQPNLQI